MESYYKIWADRRKMVHKELLGEGSCGELFPASEQEDISGKYCTPPQNNKLTDLKQVDSVEESLGDEQKRNRLLW